MVSAIAKPPFFPEKGDRTPRRLVSWLVIILVLMCATARAESRIDNYAFLDLAWGSTVKSLHENFPNAKEGDAHLDDEANHIQRWYLTPEDSIKDLGRVDLVFVNGRLSEFQLTYITEPEASYSRPKPKGIDWKQLLKSFSDQLGAPESDYEEKGLKLVYHWDFGVQGKEVFLLPSQTMVQTLYPTQIGRRFDKLAVVKLRMKNIPGEPKDSGFPRFYTEEEKEKQAK